MLGVVSGALTAYGSILSVWNGFSMDMLSLILISALSAGILNAASNGINQICDYDIDAVNKPERPLVSGRMSHREAWIFTGILYLISLIAVWPIVPIPHISWADRWTAPIQQHQAFFFFLVAAIFTLIYSMPAMGRTKRMTFGANLTIAFPRGLFLKVAGWSVLGSMIHWEPWLIGGCFFFFLIGAASTKDFSDMDGDRIGGCLTLPMRFGVRKAAFMIAPSFVLPWLLIPAGLLIHIEGHPVLTGNPWLLIFLFVSLISWGSYTVYLILRDPDALSQMENHPSWKHMYLMMLWAQVGFALAYIWN
jgi:4-hydroxybenzoate polyprenyltransferase